MTEKPPTGPATATIVRPKNKLAAKLGLKPGQELCIPPETIDRMNKAIAQRTKALAGMFSDEVAGLRSIVCTRPCDWIEQVYEKAHDIRGLAASFGKEVLGRFAADLCLYIERLPDRAKAEAAIVTAYAEAMVSASNCREIVAGTAEQLLSELKALAEAHIRTAK